MISKGTLLFAKRFWQKININLCQRMSSQSVNNRKLIAVCQLNCKENKDANFDVAKSLIQDASIQGCKMAFLPECFDMICENRKSIFQNSEPIDGPLITKYKELAKENKIWLSLGGLHERNTNSQSEKVLNAHIVIDENGEIVSIYRKTHLFNLEIPGVVRLVESEFSIAGDRIIPPVQTSVGHVGLGICYDLRFAEFAISLAKSGCDILTYPSSFTVPTGLAHWECLLRARAIETQCYVVAAAQTGTHNAKRSSYGHALIIDPWGAVIAQCSDKVGFAVAEIDFDFLKQVRQKLPVWTDRRPELYGSIIPAQPNLEIQQDHLFNFGAEIQIPANQVFLKSQHSFAFVNHRPVLPGHVLISPLRNIKRLNELSSNEIADLFVVVQKVQKAIETEYNAKSSTVAIQDGPDAGQSIEHLHVHILPRKPSDFGGQTDQIYVDLQKHDKAEHNKKYPIRSMDDMIKEALKLRQYFK